jgi:hypothetical protein
VLAGINKSIQTVSVFVVSTVFCKEQPSQCFTWMKFTSLSIVILSVLMYAHASSFVEAAKDKKPKNKSEMPLVGSRDLEMTPARTRERTLTVDVDSDVEELALIPDDHSPESGRCRALTSPRRELEI